jgi:hypothetical protein
MTLFPKDASADAGDLPFWRRAGFGPGIVIVAALMMLVWTWGTWPDLLVDFGVQLYVPWRLAAGEVLYRDIAHYTGPLSVYFNAFAFRIFGTSLRVLVLCNLPILGGIIAEIYWLGNKLGGRVCATACGLTFVTLFAFSHLTQIGNYNYVCPYEYEYTHAMLLCFGCLIFLWRLLENRRALDAGLAGLLVGLVFLTRAEFFVAVLAAAGFALLLSFIKSESLAKTARSWLYFSIAVLIPPLVSVICLSLAMPMGIALHGTLGMWPGLLAGNVTSQVFYHHSMGLDHPGESIRLLGMVFGFYLLILLWPIGVAWMIGRKFKTSVAIFTALVGIVVFALVWRRIDWISAFRPLPVVAMIVVAGAVALVRRHQVAGLAGMLGIFSLVLLGKVILYARIEQYGCWLAMPATMLLVMIIFGWIPAWLKTRGHEPAVYLAGMAGVWGTVLVIHLVLTNVELRRLKYTVGSGGDEFLAANPAVYVNRAVDLADQVIPADKTLTCFPEGIMINYLTRRRTATRYVNFNPPDLLLFGEQNMATAMEKSPPDFIFIVHKDTSEFGERFFGVDYGKQLGAWIGEHYHQRQVLTDLGAPPLRDHRFGIRLYLPDGESAQIR